MQVEKRAEKLRLGEWDDATEEERIWLARGKNCEPGRSNNADARSEGKAGWGEQRDTGEDEWKQTNRTKSQQHKTYNPSLCHCSLQRRSSMNPARFFLFLYTHIQHYINTYFINTFFTITRTLHSLTDTLSLWVRCSVFINLIFCILLSCAYHVSLCYAMHILL